MEFVVPILLTVISAATPLLLAALGELVTEKSGVLNLGIEGMMLMGAVTGFAATVTTGSATVGILCALLAGVMCALLFGFLTLTLMANQVASGLALTLFGVGLSALVGHGFVGQQVTRLPSINLPGLSDLPVIGPILFSHDLLVYLSVAMVFVVAWFVYKTRSGLVLRAVGESHDAAHALGYSVIRVRYLAVMFGGAMSGLAGAFLSLSYTPLWSENMTSGRGWIALALVVFAAWRPGRLLLGAYLFGGIMILQLHAQGFGVRVSPQILSMLPYLVTIIALMVISHGRNRVSVAAPANLAKPFRAPV